jgi:UDPglucose 6-dehydrogenase
VVVRAFDPEGMEHARRMMPDVAYFQSPYEAAEGCDAIVLVTEWDVLRALDLRRIAGSMRTPVLVDLRNVYPPEEVASAGLAWHGVGRSGAATGNRSAADSLAS